MTSRPSGFISMVGASRKTTNLMRITYMEEPPVLALPADEIPEYYDYDRVLDWAVYYALFNRYKITGQMIRL